jgi:hypothetical protein
LPGNGGAIQRSVSHCGRVSSLTWHPGRTVILDRKKDGFLVCPCRKYASSSKKAIGKHIRLCSSGKLPKSEKARPRSERGVFTLVPLNDTFGPHVPTDVEQQPPPERAVRSNLYSLQAFQQFPYLPGSYGWGAASDASTSQ